MKNQSRVLVDQYAVLSHRFLDGLRIATVYLLRGTACLEPPARKIRATPVGMTSLVVFAQAQRFRRSAEALH